MLGAAGRPAFSGLLKTANLLKTAENASRILPAVAAVNGRNYSAAAAGNFAAFYIFRNGYGTNFISAEGLEEQVF